MDIIISEIILTDGRILDMIPCRRKTFTVLEKNKVKGIEYNKSEEIEDGWETKSILFNGQYYSFKPKN